VKVNILGNCNESGGFDEVSYLRMRFCTALFKDAARKIIMLGCCQEDHYVRMLLVRPLFKNTTRKIVMIGYC
jgi:hypothetical protein